MAEFDMDAAIVDLGSSMGFDTDVGADDDDLGLGDSNDAGDSSDDNPPDADGAAQSKQGVSGTPPASPEAPKPAGSEPPAEDAGITPPPAPDAAPKTWRAEAAAKWAALDPQIKAEVLKREDDMYRGLEVYKEDANWGKGIKGLLAPYLPIMQQHNIQPMEQVSRLMNAHYTLATGSPEARGKLLGQLISDYKIDPNLVPLPGDEPAVTPEVKALRADLEALKSDQSKRQAAELAETRKQQDAAITTFAQDPKNLYFNELGHDMAKLIEKGLATSLEDAYKQAIWLNPVTRDKENTRLGTELAAKQKAEADAKAAEARKASAANVKSRPKSGSATAPLGTMDDTMAATLAAIKAREA